uniref:glycosyltransferase n=1 Tax=Roseovarius indicus TaxID=540747 RepID=UPI003B522B62
MNKTSTPLRVAIAGTNNDTMYSGGRYHALIIAYALARIGMDVTFITNKRPRFFEDLDPLAPGQVRYVFTPDFRKSLPQESFDYVILIPTGIFLPEFYEAVFEFTRNARARMALINFESGNWFNEVSPAPRDLRLWEYWRRAVAESGLVISSLRTSDLYAREFYGSVDPSLLRFEVCGPPINSPAAADGLNLNKDGSVIAFVRSSDAHKGGADLLKLEPSLLEGRTLKIIAGGPVDGGFADALRARFEPAGARLEFHSAITDEEKFILIGKAQALIFPSRFEGFGYPPVEAAYLGTEIACYDLEVLEETVGDVAHFAPVGDVAALGEALSAALAQKPRREELHTSVKTLVEIDEVALRLSDILLRSMSIVQPNEGTKARAAWGPFVRDEEDAEVNSVPALPPLLRSYRTTATGAYLLSVLMCSPTRWVTGTIEGDNLPATKVCTREIDRRFGEVVLEVSGHLSKMPSENQELSIILRDADDEIVAHERIRLGAPEQEAGEQSALAKLLREKGRTITAFEGRVEPMNLAPVAPDEPISTEEDDIDVTLALRDLSESNAGTTLFLDVSEKADRISFSHDSVTWVHADVEGGYAELFVPETALYKADPVFYVFSGERMLEVFSGIPPFPGLHAQVPPHDHGQGTIELIDLRNEHWRRGVLRRPGNRTAGTVACMTPHLTTRPQVDDTVRLATGRLLRIEAIDYKGSVANLHFGVEIDPDNEGYPNTMTRVDRPSGVSPIPVSAPNWAKGFWIGDGTTGSRVLLLPYEAVDAYETSIPLSLVVGKTQEVEIERVIDNGDGYVTWLRDPIEVFGSDISEFDLIPSSSHIGLTGQADKAADGWPKADIWKLGEDSGRIVNLAAGAKVKENDVLVFEGQALRAIQAVHSDERATYVLLDLAPPNGATAPIRLASFRERTDLWSGQTSYPSGVESPGVSKILRMNDRFRKALPATPQVPSSDRPRVLFASIVPPDPANQGNRIVTRNFISHLISQGFDVDLLLIGHVSPERMFHQFGDRVRVFPLPFPNWTADPSTKLRRHVSEQLRHLESSPAEREIFKNLLEGASYYHPFYIVPDSVVRTARALYRANSYHSIVCNYTHMIRIACELAPIRPLPPVTVVTHDALSRLPLEFDGKPFDTMYRRCTPEMERDVLNAVPGATILAISASERDYFQEIGVTNPIELCEYDGLKECSLYKVLPQAFESRRLIFHASNNPMNQIAIDWFLNVCWSTIRKAVPDATLAICGAISQHVDASITGIERHGSLEREKLMGLLGSSAVAINPTLVGTGLKIKTVEAICAGLPSVCLPAAIEGLEDVADEFCIAAEDGPGFINACIRLLSDRDAWQQLSDSSMALAKERFSETAIYGPVDGRMGWDLDVDARIAAERPDYDPDQPPDLEDLLSAVFEEDRKLVETAIYLESIDARTSASTLLNRASVQQGSRGPYEFWLKAASMANTVSPHSTALSSAARCIAERPTDGAAYVEAIKAALEQQETELAEAIWLNLALSLPGSQAVVQVAEELDLVRARQTSHLWKRSPIRVPLNSKRELTSLVPPGKFVGPGWSVAEQLGAWTCSRYARLDLTFPATSAALNLVLTGHQHQKGLDSGSRFIRFSVDGEDQGIVEIPFNSPRSSMTFHVPPPEAEARTSLSISLEIRNPSPLRLETGEIKDARSMGYSLRALLIEEKHDADATDQPKGKTSKRMKKSKR